MALKRKKRKVAKETSATPEHEPQPQSQDKPKSNIQEQSIEFLINKNGTLVEELYNSEVWQTILLPLIEELKSSVSGRLTDGQYYHGTLTKDWTGNTSIMLAGYQKAIMDFNNHIYSFITAKKNLLNKKKEEEANKKPTFYDPFMEDDSDGKEM